MAQKLKARIIYDVYWNEQELDGLVYLKDEVDAVLAEKDAEIGELKAKLENVNELVKAANKFVDDLKNSDCFKKDDEIKELKKSVQFFSDLHHNESESAKECFRRLMDLGLIDGWGLTKKFFVMPKYTKERLAQFEKQESEIAELKAQVHDYAQGMYVIKAMGEKEIRHQKYKRCVAMAKWCCDRRADIATPYFKSVWYRKWELRWLKLAEKFKEAK